LCWRRLLVPGVHGPAEVLHRVPEGGTGLGQSARGPRLPAVGAKL